MRERILITGASGFIGYHLVEAALKNNLDVYAAVRQSSQISHLKKFDIQYVFSDFDDVKSLKKEIEQNKYNYILHAAGVTKARSAEEYEDINAGYTNNIALAVLECGNQLKKLVFISSLAAIGPLNTLDGLITENTFPAPVTAYGRSKLLAEENLKRYPSLNYTVLRPTAVYGPRDKDIFIFFKQLARGLEPYIGTREQQLSFLYVTDLANAAIKSLYTNNKNTYNLSDGNYYGRYQLADITKEILGSKTLKFHLPVNFVKMIASLSEKYSSLSNKAAVLNREKLNELMAVNWYCAIENARADLNFTPQYNLQTGVAETLMWYKVNKWI